MSYGMPAACASLPLTASLYSILKIKFLSLRTEVRAISAYVNKHNIWHTIN